MSPSKDTDDAGAVSTVVTADLIEAEIVARRQALAANVDQLLYEVQPKTIANRQLARVNAQLKGLTHTPDGQLRSERIAGVLGAAAVALIGIGLLRRRSG